MLALIGHANFPFQSAIDSKHSLKLPLFSLKNTFTTYIPHVTSSFGKHFIYLFRNKPNIILKAVIIGHYNTKHLDSCTCSNSWVRRETCRGESICTPPCYSHGLQEDPKLNWTHFLPLFRWRWIRWDRLPVSAPLNPSRFVKVPCCSHSSDTQDEQKAE